MRIRHSDRIYLSTSAVLRGFIGLYFVISIFEPYLNGIIGSVTKYYMFFVMFALLWQNNFRLKLRKISLFYVAWLLLKLMSLLWSEDYTIPKIHMISQLGMVLYLVIMISRNPDEKTMNAVETTYWLASLSIGVLSIFFSDAYRGQAEARQVLVFMGQEIDPNNQAALLLVGIALSLNNLLYQKRRMGLSALGLIINCYACFQTSSRAALVTLGALVVFCVLYSPQRRSVRLVLRNVVMLCGAVVILYYAAVKLLPEASFTRLFDFSDYGGGSERVWLWTTTWSVFTRDLLTVLFGAGWGTAFLYLNGAAVHNTFLAMLCNVGLIGTLLFMIPIVVVALRMLKRKEPMSVLLLGAQFVPVFFIEAINKRFFWNAVLILFMSFYSTTKQKSNNEN